MAVPPVALTPPGALAQVRAVLAFRAATVRGPARRRLTWAAAVVAFLPLLVIGAGLLLPAEQRSSALALMPTAWLAVLVSTVISAAASGGGRSLLPPEQRSAFPWSPAADHLGALLLAPVNVSWLIQSAGLLTLTAWVTGARPGLVWAELLTAGWIVFATCAGQAIGWAIELTRTSRLGQQSVRALFTLLGVGFVVLLAGGDLVRVLNQSPTTPLVADMLGAGGGAVGAGARLSAELVVATGLSWWAGLPLIRMLQRRPARSQARVELRLHRGRADAASDYAAMLRIDRAGVWRSVPLRRGLFALALIPALAALAAGLDWALVPVLPGLVISGAGLLFGVNAWCLDASGSIWRASLPGSPSVALAARLTVITEMCLLGGVLAVAAAMVRAPGLPSAVELLGVVLAILVTTAQVVSRCAAWSTDHPYAAALRDSRDQPAPPGAMAGYAARLSVVTTVTALVLSTLVRFDQPAALIALSTGLLLLSMSRTIGVSKRWADPVTRSRILASVTG